MFESDLASAAAGVEDAPVGCGPLLPEPGPVNRPLRQQVFEQVRASGRMARADVTRSLSVSAGSVTSVTADLIAMGLLREVHGAPRDGGRGRPPVALEVVPGAGRVIGIKLSDETHTAVVADFSGAILAEASLAAPPLRRSAAEVIEEIAQLTESVLAQAGLPAAAIGAVGIGLSGLVDPQTRRVAWSPLLARPDVDLEARIAERLGLPVRIDNDANMLTLAELWFGEGRGKSDFAVVTIENGVGMGLVQGNRLWRGSRGMGMELGHTKVQLDGALCRCGARGCLEAYLADYALAREASTALGRSVRNLQSPQGMLESLYAEAKAGNQTAQTIFRRAGRYLAVGLANVAQLFDPDLIILSGERMRYDYLYAEEVMALVRDLTLSHGRSPVRVEIHRWGDMVWARGAAALALSGLTERLLGVE